MVFINARYSWKEEKIHHYGLNEWMEELTQKKKAENPF